MSTEVALALVFVFGTPSEVPPPKEPVPIVLPTDSNEPAPDGYRWVKRGDGPWKLEKIVNAPGVAVPNGATFQSGGCGCTAGGNCGASFCKSKGGTGCPQSCPVKQK